MAAFRSRTKECVMEREDEVIDLGTASIETKGGAGLVIDAKNGQQLFGIADD